VRDPVTARFLTFVVVALAYELALALTMPPNNADSLTYHLSRVAAWAQHHGIHWIPNAPDNRLNEFQSVAEQEILFLFVATGKGALFALPQYLAELATLVAVYGASRWIGYGVRAAACSAFLLATFALVALESTTSQNDLVAASFPAAAACLVLGQRRLEPALAGLALAIGAGVKLTTVLTAAFVVMAALAVALTLGQNRRKLWRACSGRRGS
jgi:4-amino-4-deoxy-L-arabinose transferase-like glycosyltransferase